MMRKMIGSILILCMLITAIPISVAAQASTPAMITEEEGVDLHSLYVTDGLVAHLSVLGTAADSASLASGVWQDRVSGASATLGNKQYWERRADGAVGFDILYGVYENGKVTLASDAASPLPTDRYASRALATYSQTRLQLGLALLPNDDFTIEYVARYNPIYVADKNGGIAKNADGSPMELYKMTGHGAPDAQYAGPADHIGFFSSFATERDGVYGKTMLERGSVLWCFGDTATPTWDTPWIGLGSDGSGGMKGAFAKRDGIHTYAIVRDEERKGNGALTAIYTLWQDTDDKNFKKSLTLSTANTGAGRVYYDKDDVGDFYLSSQTPTDFYSVRIYNRTLTVKEREQNRRADLLLYYGVNIPYELFVNESLMKMLFRVVEAEGFKQDASARAAVSERLQSIVDGEALRAGAASLYAAREDLTSLFLSFIPGTVDLGAGSWTDLITGEAAILGEKSRWSFGELGGIGFDTFCGEMIGGVFQSTSTGDNYKATGAKLDFGRAFLPADDFTVEYLAMYKPLYVYDKRNADNIARDAEGNKLETYDFDQTAVGLHLERTAIDQLGWFSSYAGQLDGVGTQAWNKNKVLPRGSIHWQFDNTSWYAGNNGLWLGKRWEIAGGLNKLDDTLRRVSEVRTYAITLDENLTVAEDGTRVTTGLFSLYRDAVFYNSNEAEGALNSTANVKSKDEWRVYADIDEEPSGQFWLSATQPTEFFTVRIYRRALSEAEMLINRTADLLYYCGVSIPEQLYGNTAAMERLVSAVGTLSFETDASARAANRAVIEAALHNMTREIPVYEAGASVGSIAALADVCILPATFASREVLAWRVGDTAHQPKTVIPVTEGLTLTAVLASAPEVVPPTDTPVTPPDLPADPDVTPPSLDDLTPPRVSAKPAACLVTKEGELGLCFTATWARADYDAIVALYGKAAVRTGLLITPEKYVQMAGGIFTREALTDMVIGKGGTESAAYTEILISDIPAGEGDITLRGTLRKFTQTTFAKNPAFAAVGFVEMDTDGDGTFDQCIYGTYNATACATVKDTFTAVRASAIPKEQAWIDSLLSQFIG